MSMLTRCPECGTSFRITTDQLVSRQGKVRCGTCQHVFSALGSLVHTRDNGAHPPSDPITPLDAQARPGGKDSEPRPGALDIHSRPLQQLDSPSRPFTDAGPPSYLPPHTNIEEDEDPSGPPVARPLQGLTLTREEDEEENSRSYAWLAVLGVLLALLALAGQGAYFYRNQLALAYPDSKPLLEEMCFKLKCKLETPLDPTAISIETSTLEADPADRNLLQLNALLRNRSSLPQALPYLELTMLDPQEQPLARRVIRPEEYASRAGAPQLAADGEYQVKLSIDASALKANGYRLYAFYP